MTTQNATSVRNAWDDIAQGYDEYVTPTHGSLAAEALRRVELRAGMRFLDVASGSGALSLPAARAGAEVLATDISAAMLDRLAARAREEGLSNLDVRVMDGHALELEDDSFDVAGSQFGVMLFPDMPRGVREMARVTRPGGRVMIVAFGPPQHVEFLDFFVRAIRAAVPSFTGLPMDPPPLPFQLQDPRRLGEVLGDAGLEDPRVETVTERLEFESAAQLWSWLMNSNPIPRGVLAGLDLSSEQRVVILDALEGLFRTRAGNRGVAVLTNPVHIGIGVK